MTTDYGHATILNVMIIALYLSILLFRSPKPTKESLNAKVEGQSEKPTKMSQGKQLWKKSMKRITAMQMFKIEKGKVPETPEGGAIVRVCNFSDFKYNVVYD